MILIEKTKAIFNTIREMSAPVKASLAFTISGIVQKGIGFITTPIFTRIMSTQDYGTYSLYLSWYSIVILVSSLNLTVAYNNALIKYKEQEKKACSSFLGISTTISFALFALYFLNQDFWNEILGLPSIITLLMLFQCMVEPAFHLWAARERFYYKYKTQIIYTIFIALGSPILGIVLIFLPGNDAIERIIANIIIVGIVYTYLYIQTFRTDRSFFSKEFWSYGLKLCIPLIPHFLSQVFLNQSDRIIISKMIGGEETALYSVAYTIAAVISIVITSVNNSLLPYVYKKLEKHDTDTKYKINKLVVVIGVFCISVMLMGPEFILIVGGSKYSEAIWVIPSVTTATFFTFIYSNFSIIEFYYEKTGYMAVGSIISALINIILNYLFLPIYGYVVAGYTTLIGYISLSIMHYIFYTIVVRKQKWIKEDIIDIKFTLVFSFIMILSMMIVLLSYNFALIRYSLIIIIFVIALINRKKIYQIITKS